MANLIYFDNAATTLKKPQAVAKTVARAIASGEIGNAGRSSYSAAYTALQELYNTRQIIAKLFNIKKPLNVSLCQNGSYALNIALRSLFYNTENTHIITTVFEHNSVLRPLYQFKEAGGLVSICTPNPTTGQFNIEPLIQKDTKAVVINHASNVIGVVQDIKAIHEICKKHNLVMIVDMCQTAGLIPIDASQFPNSIFCFTGHKGLYGPQGTGGIIVVGSFDFKPVFSGGSGHDSFNKQHPCLMPDVFEVGTMNVPSFMGLNTGVEYVLNKGINKINEKVSRLRSYFINELNKIEGIITYGTNYNSPYTGVVSLNVRKLPSSEVSLTLYEKYGIATRSGAHCAPLLHEYFHTEEQGMVRFSFSSFNTKKELQIAIEALTEIAKESTK
ncbi:MAG: aminotransferase class V-fold PLP-dependent enzyme [Treponema sp.]